MAGLLLNVSYPRSGVEASAGRRGGPQGFRTPVGVPTAEAARALTLVSAAGAIVDAAVISASRGLKLGPLAWTAATVMAIGSLWAKPAARGRRTPWDGWNPSALALERILKGIALRGG